MRLYVIFLISERTHSPAGHGSALLLFTESVQPNYVLMSQNSNLVFILYSIVSLATNVRVQVDSLKTTVTL